MAYIADIMMDYDAKIKLEESTEALHKEVKTLKRKRDAMQDREQRVMEDLNNGRVSDMITYRLPLGVLEPSYLKNSRVSGEEMLKMQEIARIKEQLTARTYCEGVTAWRGDDETKFVFDPYVGGKPFGPYVLRVKFVSGRMVLRGHSLPHAVSTRKLFEKFSDQDVREGEGRRRDLHQKIGPFLGVLSRHLRAYLSRQQQCEELREKIGEDLKEMQTLDNFTRLSFSVLLQTEGEEEEEDEEQPLVVTISMIYDKDGERPKPDSVKVKFNKEIPEEDQELTFAQCHEFYTKKLSEAVLVAF